MYILQIVKTVFLMLTPKNSLAVLELTTVDVVKMYVYYFNAIILAIQQIFRKSVFHFK